MIQAGLINDAREALKRLLPVVDGAGKNVDQVAADWHALSVTLGTCAVVLTVAMVLFLAWRARR